MQLERSNVAMLVPVYGATKTELSTFLDQASKFCAGSKIYFSYEENTCDFNFVTFVNNIAEDLKLDCEIFVLSGKKGIGVALNYSLERIIEPYVMRHDIGDDILEDRLNYVKSAINKYPDVDIFYTQAMIKRGENLQLSRYPENLKTLKRAFIYTSPICHPTVVLKKKSILEIGNYNPSLRYCEDLDLWLRAISAGLKFKLIPVATIRYISPINGRKNLHWRTNLEVRLKNFRSLGVLYSVSSITIMGLFYLAPKSVKDYVYAKFR